MKITLYLNCPLCDKKNEVDVEYRVEEMEIIIDGTNPPEIGDHFTNDEIVRFVKAAIVAKNESMMYS